MLCIVPTQTPKGMYVEKFSMALGISPIHGLTLNCRIKDKNVIWGRKMKGGKYEKIYYQAIRLIENQCKKRNLHLINHKAYHEVNTQATLTQNLLGSQVITRWWCDC